MEYVTQLHSRPVCKIYASKLNDETNLPVRLSNTITLQFITYRACSRPISDKYIVFASIYCIDSLALSCTLEGKGCTTYLQQLRSCPPKKGATDAMKLIVISNQ